MKRLIFLGMLICAAITLQAVLPSPDWADAGLCKTAPMTATVVNASPLTPNEYQTVRMEAQKAVNEASQPATKRAGVKAKAVTAISELAGNYVMTSKSLVGYGTTGREVTVSSIAGTDSIAISGFWSGGITIKGKVDLSAMTLTIPSQYMYTHSTYGAMDLSAVTSNGVPMRDEPIVGTINADGTFTITTWWCVAINSGADKDEIVDANSNTLFERPNATMTYTLPGYAPYTFGVIATQDASNVVSVKNFVNRGGTIEITLNGDRGGIIASQTAYITSQGSYMTVGTPTINEANQLVTYSPAIPLNVAPETEKRTISWGEWTMLVPSVTYAGLISSGSVTVGFDIAYPPKAAADFNGAGTEADPYLIANISDLILLADKVNNDTDRSGVISSSTQSVNYAKSQFGKFFKLTADIDMSGYRSNSIGWDLIHQFSGTFDGDGHTIKGLSVESAGFAGLFGAVDADGTIKNVNLDSPNINSTSGYYAAAIAAYSDGLISNCKVNNPKVYQLGQVAAGIVGLGNKVDNCHVTGGDIFARYGFGAGVAGQINGTISNSSATDTYVAGSSSASADPRYNGGSPYGGVVGSLFKGKATGCWFSGVVDGYTYGVSVYCGGIAGINQLGVIDQCFVAGTVMGIGQGSVNGGIVAFNSGKVTNSYASGMVNCISSYYTGGITGRLALAETGAPQPEVSNCYVSAQVRAETYQYNGAEEMRETLGRIWAGTTPKIENVYFDNQITNFRSERGGLTNSELTAGTAITGLDNTVWEYTKNAYPRLKSSASSVAAQLSASALLMPQPATTLANVNADVTLSPVGETKFMLLNNGKLSANGHFCSIKDNVLTLNQEYKMGNDTLVAYNGESQLVYYLKIAPKFLEGEGTAENPYLLKTKADVLALADATSTKQLTFADTYFAFANDIDMENDAKFKGISFSSSTTLRFAGVIDGCGHAIHNMKLDMIGWTTAPTETTLGVLNTSTSSSYVGFVSKLAATGVVKNLTIAGDCVINGLGTVGAVVGDSYGVIENCSNYAPVTAAASGAGGIAGKLENNSKVKDCFNAGHVVTGYQGVAGIAGSGTGFEITNCVNVGLSEAKAICTARDHTSTVLKYAAGIVGNVGGAFTVANCADYGHSYAEVGVVGSICGRSYGTPTLTGNLALGTIACADVVGIGMMAGEVPAAAKYTNNYWDAQMLPWNAAVAQPHEGATGVETSVLTSGEALTGFADGVWSYAKGRYPVPAAFAELPEVKAATVAYFELPAGVTVEDLKADVTLPTTENRVWSVADGSNFSLKDNVLDVPEATKELQTGSMTVNVNNIYSKTFSLSVLPKMPFDGQGTVEAPYLIKNADDWNQLATYMESTGESFEGKFLAVTADIDFNGVTILPIAADGKTSFSGYFDGQGHTLKNIKLNGTTQYFGLIGSLGVEGKIANFTFQGTVNTTALNVGGVVAKSAGTFLNCVSEMEITTNKNYAGGFVGLATGGAFRDCVSKSKITTNSSYAGGFIGQGTTGPVIFTNCVAEGEIVSTIASTTVLYHGGFIGSSFPSIFGECKNKSKITAAYERANGVAGFIGYANGAANSGKYVFMDCRNESDITIGYGVAGFIYAAITSAGVAPMEFTNCENTGKITATYNSSKAVGFVGMATGGSVFTNCVNSGDIVCEGGMAAGIVSACATTNATNTIQLINCKNTAPILAKGSTNAGIIASGANFTYVTNCYNTGKVTGSLYVGGILGSHSTANGKLIGCWNSGEIVASGGRVGGIVGAMYGTAANVGDVLVKDCFNVAPVSTTSTLQGISITASNPSGYAIGGLGGYCSGRFENSYNMGEVKGVSRIGGLVGDPGTNKKFSMANCYNAGAVVAPADTCGAIVGINTANGKLWVDGCVTNTYYVAGTCASTLPLQGTELTVKELCEKNISTDFTSLAANCFPVVKSLDKVEAAILYAGQPIFGESQSATNVTGTFEIGSPEGVTWTLTGASIEDGKVVFSQPTKGEVELVGKTENMTRVIPLTLNVTTSGLSELDGDMEVVSRIYFTTDGIQVAEPASADGKLYIVVTTYADGTHKATRFLNK